MRLYSADDEARIYTQGEVRAWTQAGLLEAGQGTTLTAELRTGLKRTYVMLRAVLALFTAILTAASVGFVVVVFHLNGQGESALAAAIGASVCYAAAEQLAARVRFYRYGPEEALAAAAIVLLGVSAALGAQTLVGRSGAIDPAIAGLLVAATLSLVVSLRFGFVHAAVVAMACAALIPFQTDLPDWMQRLTAAIGLAIAFAVARTKRRRARDDYRAAEHAIQEAAAWAGVYLALNLRLSDVAMFGVVRGAPNAWFYWASYALTWLLPAAGLTIAIRDRTRPLLTISLAMALATLATNKTYLGVAHQSWDPMLLGVLLMGTALGVRRWLAAGPGGERAGFTPWRILDADREVLRTVANISAGFHPQSAAATAPREEPGFGGGRSGGGGASGSF